MRVLAAYILVVHAMGQCRGPSSYPRSNDQLRRTKTLEIHSLENRVGHTGQGQCNVLVSHRKWYACVSLHQVRAQSAKNGGI